MRRVVTGILLALAACSSHAAPPPATESVMPSETASSPAAWSPPAVLVERSRALFVLEGGTARRISIAGFYPSKRPVPEPPIRISPSGRWALAYTSVRPGWFVLPLVGGATIRLPAPAKAPVWGPGDRIAYVMDGDLHIQSAPGAGDTMILSQKPTGCCQALAWMRGTIAIEVLDRGLDREQVWTVAVDGKGLRMLYQGSSCNCVPRAWALGMSPDGSVILTTNANKPVAIPIGRSARALGGIPVVHQPGYTWSGTRVLVERRVSGAPVAWEHTTDATVDTIAGEAAGATDAFVSPDRATLAVTLRRKADDRVAVFTVGVNGGTPTRLSDWLVDATMGGWSRDGKSIVFGSRSDVFGVPSIGGTVRRLGRGSVRAVL